MLQILTFLCGLTRSLIGDVRRKVSAACESSLSFALCRTATYAEYLSSSSSVISCNSSISLSGNRFELHGHDERGGFRKNAFAAEWDLMDESMRAEDSRSRTESLPFHGGETG
jgi:hypothetical protein